VSFLVSVIIPVLNGAAVLAEQLNALANQQLSGAWEVIIADNGSTDALAAVCAQFASILTLTLVDASGLQSPAHARNVGVAHARGALLAFCDQDDVVKPGWLQALVDSSRCHDVVAGALDYQALNAGMQLPDYWKRIPENLPRKLGFLPFGSTCNLMVRRQAFECLGGFSEDFNVSDDVDFSWRAQLAGYRIGYAPDAQIEYRLRRRAWARAKRRYEFGRDQVHLYRKFRGEGMPRDSWPRVVKDWGRNLALLPAAAFNDQCRNTVEERFPYRLGRLAGSVHWRVRFL
jgi:glycosyltransferase involved in cell wall biosynthesis